MNANPALRLVAIDPSLTHTGLAEVRVTAMNTVEVVRHRTIETTPDDTLIERLSRIHGDVGVFLCHAELRQSWLDGVVIEDPTESVHRSATGIRKDPRNIYKLVAAFGSAAAAVAGLIDGERITSVGVARWYPRSGRGTMRHDHVLAQIRSRHPELDKASEHVCFAVGMATWWSAEVAPVVWHQRRQRATA